MRKRAVSVFQESWGRSTVYECEETQPEPEQLETVKSESQEEIAAGASVQASAAGSKLISYSTSLQSPSALPILRVDEPANCCLGQFEAALLASILEDTIIQLHILESCNTEMRTRRTEYDMDRLLSVKFGVEAEREGEGDELEGVDPKSLRSDRYKLIKLQRDRDCFRNLVRLTYEELTLEHAFCQLRRALLTLTAEEEMTVFVAEEELRNRMRRRELERQLRQQRVLNKSQTCDADNAIDVLLTNVEDVTLNGDIRARYVSRWQNARSEQHTWRLRAEEAGPELHIDQLKDGSDNEQRVHAELEMMIAVDVNETLQKIEEWMDKYERDMERVDLDIQIARNDYQNARDKRIHLEKTLEEHAGAIVAWTTFKEAREKDRQFRARMRASACSVQAWWRGLLVRRQLGPYRVSKKPKPKKK